MPELVTTKPGKPKPPKKITIDNVSTHEATISWSVGLCVTGGAVQRYEIKLTDNKTDLSNNDVQDDSRIQFKNQDKQGKPVNILGARVLTLLTQRDNVPLTSWCPESRIGFTFERLIPDRSSQSGIMPSSRQHRINRLHPTISPSPQFKARWSQSNGKHPTATDHPSQVHLNQSTGSDY